MSPCCCGPNATNGCPVPAPPDDRTTIVDVVNAAYSKVAREGADRARTAFGYTPEQLASVSAEAHMGLSCGNPVAAASIKEGETVLDLGSGGGIDVFLAADRVGPTSQVIGLDNSDDMIARARRIATSKGLAPPHVAFVKASLTADLPIANDGVDCVLNLLPPAGKRKVVAEVYRVLRPGGRVTLDDIVAREPFSESLRSNVAAYVGCISGAVTLEEYRALLQDAGFKDVLFKENASDLNVYLGGGSTGCCGPATHLGVSTPLSDIGDLNALAKSYQIYAIKPDNAAGVIPPRLASALKDVSDAYAAPESSALVSNGE